MRRMYSKEELRKIVLNSLENEDVKVKTIEQSEYEYSQEIELTPTITGAVVEDIYSRCVVSDGFLHIILNFKVSNPTESPISGYSLINTPINLPKKYAQKIVDIDGKSIAENNPDKFIACAHAFWGPADIMAFGAIGAQNVWMGLNNSSTLDRMNLVLIGSSQIQIQAGKTHLVSARLSLSLK